MSYVHIKTTFDCLLKIENLEKVLNKNKTYSFLTQEEILNIIVYPLLNTSSNLPFAFKFDTSCPYCQKNVDIITFLNNNYLITISPFYIGSSKHLGVKSKSLTFAKTNHTLFYTLNSNFNIRLECESSFCDYSFNEKISSLEVKTIEDNVLIYSKLQNNLGFIFCNISFKNNNYKLITLDKINLIEIKNNAIYTYKKLNDISHHGEVNKYDISKKYNRISYIVYDSNFPIIVKHKELIPFAYFEAIKIENYKLARSYMSKTLSEKLTNSHIKKFFGSFTEICLPLKKENYEDEISLVYEEKLSNLQIRKFAKNFKISINASNKIDNITEL